MNFLDRTTVSLRRQLTKQLLPLATAMGPLETPPQGLSTYYVFLLHLILLLLVLQNLFLPVLTTLQPFPRAAPDTTGETGLTNSSRQ